jgi:hypothetical protein
MYCYDTITEDSPRVLNELYSLFNYFYMNNIYKDRHKLILNRLSSENIQVSERCENTLCLQSYECLEFYSLVQSVSDDLLQCQHIDISWKELKNNSEIRHILVSYILNNIQYLNHTINKDVLKIMKQNKISKWHEIIATDKLSQTVFGLIKLFLNNLFRTPSIKRNRVDDSSEPNLEYKRKCKSPDC